ncbi:MAG: glycosyltransferase [candidate division Zixibacteria bacterium]|nr:glycosyltransferase [candidate division Zixibacteria bacterium]
MRILFLSDAETYHTQRWVDYFADQGHRCFLISLERGFRTKAEEFIIPPRCPLDFLKYALSVPRISKIARTIKPDLVNAHFVPSYGLIGALLKIHPLVVSTWGSDVLISPQKSRLQKLRAQYVLKRADLVTADSSVSAEAAHRLGVEREKVVTYPMGVARDLIGAQEKKDKPYLLIMTNRRLEPLYDVVTMVKAIPLVIETVKKEDVRFVIIGEGSLKRDLLNLAVKLKAEGHVEFKGIVSRQELIRHYQDADIYVSTSLSDSTSVSLLEAMNFGLIPIVTDVPGNREWIEDQKNGLLFPPSNHRALAEKITCAVNVCARWPEFRKKNETIIKSRAVWEDNMKAVEGEFLRILGRSSDV